MMAQEETETRAGQRRIVERMLSASRNFRPIPYESDESVIVEFERMAQAFPEQIALKQEDTAISYRRLNKEANRLARAILAAIGEGDEPVGLLSESGVEAVILMLAARKAGKFFVGLDASMPPDRLGAILADCPVRLIVAHRDSMEMARRLASESGAGVIAHDAGARLSGENVGKYGAPDALFCVMYTSGTTGAPKGVILDERSIRHRIATVGNTALTNRLDRAAVNHSVWFLATLGTTFTALLTGGNASFFDANRRGLDALRVWLDKEEITIFTPTPTLFRQFASALPDGFVFSTVRLVRLGSERSLAGDFALYQKHFAPTCILRVGYGISEASLVAERFLDHSSRIEDTVISVGYATPGTDIRLVGEDGNEVASGEIGEIVVRSRYLARGYWGQPALTAARFLPDPDDSRVRRYRTGDLGRFLSNGMLRVVGRVDAQLKVRGYRVEPVEIESALLDLPGVAAAVVVGRSDAEGETRLAAYLVCEGTPPRVSELRAAVARRLPDFMIPQRFVLLDALPMLVNGKVDFRALPEPSTERPEIDAPFVAPRSPLEASLARIWQAVLQVDAVGIHDPFLDLGGNSIQAAKIAARIQQEIGAEIDMAQLLSAATVQQMAALLQRSLTTEADASTLASLLAE